MATVKVDFGKATEKEIRPLHGVNSGPMTKVFTYDARPLFKEARFPFGRLHDVEYPYGSGEFVDIPCIFKDFNADENLPENYNFGLTDEYISHMIEVGCEPLYRLGVSIEHAPVKRYIYPPCDFDKWARICEHIIRHYTEGWADGYHWNMRYWEIWCEADGHGNMWLGTPEEFYELYCVSAKHLKACFPHLKIGGCGYTKAYNEFIENFFKYISSRPERIPLDFFSWHRYFSCIESVVKASAQANHLLEKYGYPETENVMDEWNYMRDWEDQADSYPIIKNHIGAAFGSAVMCTLQTKTDVSLAAYFESDVVKEWCGLFEVKEMGISRQHAKLGPLKPFYPFKCFNKLYELKKEVTATSEDEKIYVCAASNGKEAGLMVSNFDNRDTNVTFKLSGLPNAETEVRVTDENRTYEKILSFNTNNTKDNITLSLPVKNNTFLYIGSPIT